MTTEKKPNNQLGDVNKMKLWMFLQGIKSEIDKERMPPSMIAEKATASLGFGVTKHNVYKGLRVCGITVYRRFTASGERRNRIKETIDAQAVRIEQLEARCAKLQADMDAMQKLVEETVKNLTRRWEMVGGKAVPK